MITEGDITHWRTYVPWPDANNVEQDLILSRLMIEIAQHPLLKNELVMRGGTCFHKLWLDQPMRYSEDLDYVRRTQGPIREILDALHEMVELVGFDDVVVKIQKFPKIRFRADFNSGRPMRIKVEINTFERSPSKEPTTRPLQVESPWYSGAAEIPTFRIEELVATKIRALYQRRKGRDLFDLWLAVKHAGVSPEAIAECFDPYRPDGWTVGLALANLTDKINHAVFASDLTSLVPSWPDGYSIEAGAEVARAVIMAVDE